MCTCPIHFLADTLIFATGFEIDPKLSEAYKDCAEQVLIIGDAVEIGNIGLAVRSAHRTLSKLL